MMSSDEYIRKPASVKATDTATAIDVDASQPAMRSDFMQSVVPLPRPLVIKEGDMKESWRRWLQIWDSYEAISRLKKQPHDLRLATLITCIGEDALEICNSLFGDAEATHGNMDFVLRTLETHFMGLVNVTSTNGMYLISVTSKTFETYLKVLRQLAN